MKFDNAEENTTSLIFKWVKDHYGYSNILMAIFIALFIKLFFIKYDYNFFEILILLCFVMGMGMLFLTVFAIFQGITKINLMQVASGISFVYAAWAIGQFFDKIKISNYFKALGAYILGFITFTLVALIIGTIIDLVI